MDYLMCFLLPPVALFMVNKPGQAFLNFFLTLFFWFPGVIHALVVVHDEHEQRRHRELMRLHYAGMMAWGQPPPYPGYLQPYAPPAAKPPRPSFQSYRNPRLAAHTSWNVRANDWIEAFWDAFPGWVVVIGVLSMFTVIALVMDRFS